MRPFGLPWLLQRMPYPSCWYVDEKGGIGVAKDQCIFCGACAKACPKAVMEIRRAASITHPLEDTPWASEWKDP